MMLKAMFFGIEDIIINDTPVENVDKFVFIGSCIPNTTDF